MTTATGGPLAGAVDAHLHCWDRVRHRHPWLDADPATPARYVTEDLPGDVRGAVLVEADAARSDALDEAAWLASLGAAAVVAFAPVGEEALGAHLDRLAALAQVTAVRRLLQDEPGELLGSPALTTGLRAVGAAGLAFDACVRDHQLDALLRSVRSAPDTVVVLDHLGKPPLRDGWRSERAQRWHRALRLLAQEPHVVVKLSGLPAEAAPGPLLPQAAPFVQAALAAFGPDRALAGSDRPVSRVPERDEAYGDWFRYLATGAGLDAAEAAAVLGGTARRVYRIPEDR